MRRAGGPPLPILFPTVTGTGAIERAHMVGLYARAADVPVGDPASGSSDDEGSRDAA
jgi:hypothetical protein